MSKLVNWRTRHGVKVDFACGFVSIILVLFLAGFFNTEAEAQRSPKHPEAVTYRFVVDGRGNVRPFILYTDGTIVEGYLETVEGEFLTPQIPPTGSEPIMPVCLPPRQP